MKNTTLKMVLFWLCLASTASAQQIHSAYFMIEDFKSMPLPVYHSVAF